MEYALNITSQTKQMNKITSLNNNQNFKRSQFFNETYNNRPQQTHHNDQFTFSDVYVRKPNLIISRMYCASPREHSKRNNLMELNRKSKQTQQLHKQQYEGRIFTLPRKKIQIKISSYSKNLALLSSRNPISRQLISQRVSRHQSFTSHSTNRYKQQNLTKQPNRYIQSNHRIQRKSDDFVQKGTIGISVKNIKTKLSLAGAYKVQSMILRKNPKTQLGNEIKYQRQNSQINYQRQMKFRSIDSETRVKTRSLKPVKINHEAFMQVMQKTNRKDQNINKIHINSQHKRQLEIKFNHVNQNLSRQVNLEPWTKNQFEDLNQFVSLQNNQYSPEKLTEYQTSISRNSYRKFHIDKIKKKSSKQ